MIKAIVVDDEWYNLEEISDLVDSSGFMKVVCKYQNPVKALEEISIICPEVAFLDIEMPEIDGLTLAEKIQEKNPGITVAFITSFNQYAVQAFDLNAIDYILKPVRMERFRRMLEKIQNKIETNRAEHAGKLKIRCFQQFETTIDGVPVKWERSKAEEVFAYLLTYHNNYISKEILLEHIWPDAEPHKALRILQTSICRIRNVFSGLQGSAIIDYSNSKYCLMLSSAECDFFEMEEALNNFDIHKEETYAPIENAFTTYQGGFFKTQGYLWIMEKNEEWHKKFERILRDIVIKYSNDKNQNEQIRFLKHIAMLLPYDNEINYTLIRILKENGYEYEVQKHYEWLKKVLEEDYDMYPSDNINKLVKEN